MGDKDVDSERPGTKSEIRGAGRREQQAEHWKIVEKVDPGRHWERDLSSSGLFRRWSLEELVREWGKWDNEGNIANAGCIDEQVTTVGSWGSLLGVVRKTCLVAAHVVVRGMRSLSSGRQWCVLALRSGKYVGKTKCKGDTNRTWTLMVLYFSLICLVVVGVHLNGQWGWIHTFNCESPVATPHTPCILSFVSTYKFLPLL